MRSGWPSCIARKVYRYRVIAIVLVFVWALATTLNVVTASASPPATRVIRYSPFARDGKLKTGIHVRTKAFGTCFGGGVAGGQSFRCIANNQIHDPCFARSLVGPLYCPQLPIGNWAVEVRIHGSLVRTNVVEKHIPWAIELPQGQECAKVNAAWGTLGPFSCNSTKMSRKVFADCRTPTQGANGWETLCQVNESTESPFQRMEIAKVWR
jgi:hypothetical protein